MRQIPDQEYRDRLDRAYAVMRQAGVDMALVYASRVQYGSVRYLTGYEPWLTPEEWAFALLRPGNSPEVTLFSNSQWDFHDAGAVSSVVGEVVISSDWSAEILARLPSTGRVGIVGYRSFPTGVFVDLTRSRPNIPFLDVTEAFRSLRLIKSPIEIEMLRTVGRIGDVACAAFARSAVAGASEREIGAEVDRAMALAGANQFGYFTNLASGTRTVRSCFLPDDRAVGVGDIVQLDCSPMVAGYKGDVSRVTVVGGPIGRAHALVEAAAQMYEACAAEVAPNAKASDVVEAGAKAARDLGFSGANLYQSPNVRGSTFMAHGIGMENPDPPGLLMNDSTFRLQPGMVINLEPIILQPGVGGARIEGAFVVTERGSEALTSAAIRPWLTN